uniref:Uncharacterized protein AlNc14C1G188 n=1 Tax=Albugo laibachii Nc14 TaxID=890382 RepID=F0VZ47_9STRA|nr:conserved hypothetical protein [Albugo laibachii Nc14]|eukprot:CCA14062.1 conserved hypothetical protein [Albugo laibachii Nc14]
MNKSSSFSEQIHSLKDDKRFKNRDVESHQPQRKPRLYRDHLKLPSLGDKSLIYERFPDLSTNNCSSKEHPAPALICKRVHQLLEAHFHEAALLRVDHVSCQYVQLRLLGPKRYWYQKIRRVKSNQKQWNVFIYSVRCRPSTVKYILGEAAWTTLPQLSEDDVELRHIGRFGSLEESIMAYEEAFNARDGSNPFVQWSTTQDARNPAFKRELPRQLCSYYQVTLISDAFAQCSQQKRTQKILEILLTSSNANWMDTCGKSLPIECRHVSYIGTHVANLPIWRYLHFHFIIHVKTLNQTALSGIETKQKKKSGQGERFSDVDAFLSLDEVSRHFTFDHNRVRKQRARDLLRIPDQSSVENAVYKLRVIQHSSVVAARQLQRVYRKNTQSRMVRALIKQFWAAISIQRLYRGFQGRKKLKIYNYFAQCASIVIQSVYRSFWSRKHAAHTRVLFTDAARHLQRAYRRYRARLHWDKIYRLVAGTLVLQRASRYFLACQHARRLRIGAYNRNVLFPGVKLIQSIWRGHSDRKLIKRMKLRHIQRTIQFRAAVLIQKHTRSFLACQFAQKTRNNYYCALKIQAAWRAFHRRRYLSYRRNARTMQKHASTIDAVVRGTLSRRYYATEKRRKYEQTIEILSAIKIQSIFRGFSQRLRYELLEQSEYAAVILQEAWRTLHRRRKNAQKACVIAQRCQNDAACVIQTEFRRYCARKQYFSMQIKHYGVRGKAVLILQNVRRVYRTRQRMQQLCVSTLELRTKQLLEELRQRQQQIRIDIRKKQGDWSRMRRRSGRLEQRRKELEETRKKWEYRLSIFAEDLDEDDVTKWDQVMSNERRRLVTSIQQSLEDFESHTLEMKACVKSIEMVWRELQSMELAWKQCSLDEASEVERHRKMRSIQARVLRKKEWADAVRLERLRWKPRNAQKKILGSSHGKDVIHLAHAVSGSKSPARIFTSEIEALIHRIEAIRDQHIQQHL